VISLGGLLADPNEVAAELARAVHRATGETWDTDALKAEVGRMVRAVKPDFTTHRETPFSEPEAVWLGRLHESVLRGLAAIEAGKPWPARPRPTSLSRSKLFPPIEALAAELWLERIPSAAIAAESWGVAAQRSGGGRPPKRPALKRSIDVAKLQSRERVRAAGYTIRAHALRGGKPGRR
jgi:hypothetical protein